MTDRGTSRRALERHRARPAPRRPGRAPSRCSPSPTATSGCGATSTRATPTACPGTYLNSVYELRPLPYAEAGYGYPESGQTIINVTNGKLIRLLVDDEPFDVRYGTLDAHERTLDLRAGTLSARSEWRSPAGDAVRIRSTRLVSLTQRAVAAIQLRGRAGRRLAAGRRAVRAGGQRGAARRRATTPAPPPCSSTRSWPRSTRATGTEALMVHRTRHSGLRMAAGMRHVIDGPDQHRLDDLPAPTTCAGSPSPPGSRPGEKLRIVKFLAYGWSSQRTRPALHDQVVAALAAARLTGWDGLRGRAAGLPRRVLGRRGRRARGRRRGPAGGALRPVPHPAGRRPGRAAAHPGQGPHRPRLRRPHVLGHRDLRAARAHLHQARRGGRRPALAPADPRPSPRSAPRSSTWTGAAFPWRTHPGPRVVGLLAGRHRRRSTSTPTSPTPSSATSTPPTTRSSSATSASSCWSRPPGCGAALGPPRHRGPLPHRRRHRARRVQLPSPTTTSTPTSWPQQNLRAAADVVRPPPRAGRASWA